VRFGAACVVGVVSVIPFGSSTAAQVHHVEQTSARPYRMTVAFSGDRLTVQVQDVPLGVLLEEISSRTGIACVPADGIRQEVVSAELASAPLGDALRALLDRYDTFFYYGAAGFAPSTLRAVWIYPQGAAAALRPVPPEVWAGVDDLEASLTDANPKIRERAYEALMEQHSSRGRELVLEAIRGASEQDEGVRQRLFSAAVSKGVELAADFLLDLVRGDGSPEMRVMALDALATTASPAATQQAAETALSDPVPTVRQKAADILAQLRGPE